MGITKLSLNRLDPHLRDGSSILILGCQNLYDEEHYGQLASEYLTSLGHTVRMIDITGCQGAEIADLRKDLKFKPEFDVVIDCGTKEHVDGPLWRPFKNIHEACAVGGIMIHENPKTGNWPLHGQHYFTKKFFNQLAKGCGYELLEVTEEPAMGNTKDGWNICAVLRKTEESKFVTTAQFDKYDLRAE